MSLILSVMVIVTVIAGLMLVYWRKYLRKWRCPRCGTVYPNRGDSACADGTACFACDRRMNAEFAELQARMRSLVVEARPVTSRRVRAASYTRLRPEDTTPPPQQPDPIPYMSDAFVYGDTADAEKPFVGGGGSFGGGGASGSWDSSPSPSSDSGGSCSSSDSGGSCGGGGD